MAEKTKLFYFRWFPAEAELDEDWCLMSMAERGLYMSLLNYSWLNNGLPNEPSDMARAVRLSVDEFTALWVGRVGRKFALQDGRLRNSRQEEERSAVNKKSAKNADAANKRWGCIADGMRSHSECIADAGANGMLRAYNYNSNSGYSSSLSSEMESEGKPTAEAEMDEFSVWASGIHLAHPNSSDKYQSLLTLKNRFSQDPEARESFTKHHALWTQSEKWQEKQGAFVPRLWKWIEDDGWKKAPPTPIRKQETVFDRMVREAEEQKRNGTR